MVVSVLDELQLSWYQVKKLAEDKYKVLVNSAWLHDLQAGVLRQDGRERYSQGLPSEVECKLLLEPSSLEVSEELTRLVVSIIPRTGRIKRTLFQPVQYLNTNSTLGQLMCFIQHELLRQETGEGETVSVKRPDTLSEEVFHHLMKTLYRPGALHSNSVGLLGYHVTKNSFYFCFKHYPYTLKDVICYTPALLSGTHRPLFVVYQLLHYLRSLHSRGITHDNLRTSTIFTDESLWMRVSGVQYGLDKSTQCSKGTQPDPPQTTPEYSYPYTAPAESLLAATGAWIKGYMTNLEYLLALNERAGHVYGDPNLHPIVPWVMDFTSCYGGWRDLSKSKFRLNKGDYHLDSTYKLHGFGKVTAPSWARSRRSFHEEEGEMPVTPHHLIDTLSEITYFSYYARRMPKHLLCKYVRSTWEPNEYPGSVAHVYKWTPDECIPEFYTDPTIFTSIHEDLPDMVLPPWANDNEDFISKHRDALEGDYVSSRLHLWIDLIFGDKLFGHLAVSNKNVYKELVDCHKMVSNKGVRQLFKFPHPKRLSATPPVPRVPLSKHEVCTRLEVELCEEPEYEDDDNTSGRETSGGSRRRTFHVQELSEEKPPTLHRNHSMEPSSLKQAILHRTSRNKVRNDSTSLDSIQELIYSPINITKEEENVSSKIRYLTQFFNSLGGSIWIEKSRKVDGTTPAHTFTARKRCDLQALGCVLIEMLSSQHSPNNEHSSWEQHLKDTLFLWNRNRDDIFPCYNDLIEYLLYSSDVMCSTEYILHQHCTVLPVPVYFEQLYTLLYAMYQQASDDDRIVTCGTYFQNYPDFLPDLGNSGMSLLLANLHGLFQGPAACKAFIILFDVIATNCSKKSLQELGASLEKFNSSPYNLNDKVLLTNIKFVMTVKRHLGLKYFLNRCIGYIVDDIADTECITTLDATTKTTTKTIQPSLLAMEAYYTLKQLLPALGPILTAKHVTSKLLQVLVGCHVYNEDVALRYGGEELIMKFLVDISLVYGEAFIDTQYIPRVFNMVKSAMFRVTHKNEGKLLAALTVVHDSAKCLAGPTLQNMLKDLQMFVFEPIMRLLTSTRINFPHTGSGRHLLAAKLSELLILLVKLVLSYTQSPEDGKELILPLVKQYFTMFDSVSHLYVQHMAAADVGSPAQSVAKSLDEDYFLHLKQQFPSFPKRYHSQCEDCDLMIEVGTSPVSGSGHSLVETLQMERENLIQDECQVTISGSRGDSCEDEDRANNQNISLMPESLIPRDMRDLLSMLETDPEMDNSSSAGFERVPDRRGSQHSDSLTSSSESDMTLPDEDDPSKDIDCLSDGSKRDHAILKQIEAALSPETAQNTYVHLCRLIGQETLRRTLDNIDLIEVMAYMEIEPSVSNETVPSARTRVFSDNGTPAYVHPSPLLAYRTLDQTDSLKDNWRRVWEDSVTATNDDFTFRHIYLQHYRGHTDRVNAMQVTEDDCFLLSASKDKSVILWDLRASNCSVGKMVKRYEQHTRPVLGLSYFDYSSMCICMDSHQINCIDLEQDKVVQRYESSNGLVLTDMPRTSHRIIQGTGDSTLRIFDTRVGGMPVVAWRVATSLRSIHFIKALECDTAGVWVAAGFSSGSVNVLDLRVGLVLQAFRPHHQDITKIISAESGEVYSSSTDQSVCYWKRTKSFTEGHPPDYKYIGAKEAVLGMCLMDDDLITCSNTRINTFCANQRNTSTKLRSDLFKGGVSCLAALPLNKLLVLGCDGGSIKLFS